MALITTTVISIVDTVHTLKNEKSEDLSKIQSVIGIYLALFIALTGSFKSGKSGRSLLFPYIVGFGLYFFGNIYSFLNLGVLSNITSEIVHLFGIFVIASAYRVDANSVNVTTFLPAGVISNVTNKVQGYGDQVFTAIFGAAQSAEYKIRKTVSNAVYKKRTKTANIKRKASAVRQALRS